MGAALASAQQSATGQNTSQLVLNALATPFGPAAFKPPLPATYAAWSADQRASAPRQIAARCRMIWGMANDSSRVQLLPPKQDAEDTPKLILDVCLLGKMPQDWPGRAQELADAEHILHRSAELGEPLKLPASILR